jgi:threonylcarbamoyladenosine tRNA methylthiotransferase MtaB
MVAARSAGGDGLTDPPEAPSCVGALSFGDRTRAFLKVQEGCALRCAYCIIPQVRGPSVSVPPEDVETQLRSLLEAGYSEVVLTGVNTGDYGRDLTPDTDLAALLRRLLRVEGLGRLRMNSLEPRTVTPEIISLFADEEKLAAHLQVPLQSGSDHVLGAMRRNYRVSFYADLIERLRRRVPRMGLGADVIVGHPGEGDAHFEETLRFIASSPLNYLHVFSYSPRPGTDAASRDDAVEPRIITGRSARLRELGRDLALRFRESLVGETLEVLAYDSRREDGRLRGLTGNFIEVGLDAPDLVRNRIFPAILTWAGPDGALAVPA